jgi:cell division cycle protein 37
MTLNNGMLERIDRLLTALKSHRDVAANATSHDVDGVVMQSLIESAGDPTKDVAERPPGAQNLPTERITFSGLMANLVDEVKKQVLEKGDKEKPLEGFIAGIQGHRDQIAEKHIERTKELDEALKEQKKHITSDDVHEGFSYSAVSKEEEKKADKTKAQTLELLNPASKTDEGQSSGADADIEDGGPGVDDEENIDASPDAKKFAQIALYNYPECMKFLSSHPNLLTEKDTDGLLVEAFDAQLKGQDAYAKRCVQRSLLLQYCRQLGRDGMGIFFKRIMTPGHNAQKLFEDDYQQTYARIKTRTAELNAQSAQEGSGDKEQIQLHAVDPNTKISFNIPAPIPHDLAEKSDAPPPTAEEIAARSIFESLPPNLQRAIETDSLDEVNRVLGKMALDDAEEIVGKLGDSGIISMVEQDIIDATTEEGRKKVEEIERAGQSSPPATSAGAAPEEAETALEDTVD